MLYIKQVFVNRKGYAYVFEQLLRLDLLLVFEQLLRPDLLLVFEQLLRLDLSLVEKLVHILPIFMYMA